MSDTLFSGLLVPLQDAIYQHPLDVCMTGVFLALLLVHQIYYIFALHRGEARQGARYRVLCWGDLLLVVGGLSAMLNVGAVGLLADLAGVAILWSARGSRGAV
jgi:hypothetical protein